MRKSGLGWAAVFVISAVIAQTAVGAYHDRHPLPTLLHDSSPVIRAAGRYLAAHPTDLHVYTSWRSSLPHGTDKESAEATMTTRGLRRLPDALLMKRAAIIAPLLGQLSEEECARFWSGSSGGDAVAHLTAVMDSADAEAFAALVMDALVREIRQFPAIIAEPSESQLQAAWAASVPPATAERFVAFADHPEAMSRSDMCWGAKALFEAASHDPAIAREIVAPSR